MNGFLVDLARRGHGRLADAESRTDDQAEVAAVPRPAPPSVADLPGEASVEAGGPDEVRPDDRASAPRIEAPVSSKPVAGAPTPTLNAEAPPPPAPAVPAPMVLATPIAAARSPAAAAPAPAPPSAPVASAATMAGAVSDGPPVTPPSALPGPAPTPAVDRPVGETLLAVSQAPAPVVPLVSMPQPYDATPAPPPREVPSPAADEPPTAVVTVDAAPVLDAMPPVPSAVMAPREMPFVGGESQPRPEPHDGAAPNVPPPRGHVEPSPHGSDKPQAEPAAGPAPAPIPASITDQRPALATPAPPSPRGIRDAEAGEMPTSPSRAVVPPSQAATAAFEGRPALVDASPPIPKRAPTVLPVAPAPLPAVAEPRPAELDQPRPIQTEAPLPQRSVHVRIGAVEVRAETPPPPVQIAAVRRPSVTVGFDDYRAIRSHAGWDA